MRFLHRKSVHGYTSDPRMPMHAEPEAVPLDYQRELAREARIRHALERQVAFRAQRTKILDSLGEIRNLAHGAYQTNRRIRNVEREIAALWKSFAVEVQTGS